MALLLWLLGYSVSRGAGQRGCSGVHDRNLEADQLDAVDALLGGLPGPHVVKALGTRAGTHVIVERPALNPSGADRGDDDLEHGPFLSGCDSRDFAEGWASS